MINLLRVTLIYIILMWNEIYGAIVQLACNHNVKIDILNFNKWSEIPSYYGMEVQIYDIQLW